MVWARDDTVTGLVTTGTAVSEGSPGSMAMGAQGSAGMAGQRSRLGYALAVQAVYDMQLFSLFIAALFTTKRAR